MTKFEQKVYDVVKTIPRGETRTYAWIAEQIGSPKAVRAVGNALHKNPFAPQVPCHRVIRSDGSLGGYVHGAEKKRKMLEEEGASVAELRSLSFGR